MDKVNFFSSEFQHSRLSIPSPLMVTEKKSFAHYTITKRLPATIKQIIENNNFSPPVVQNLENLSQEIFDGFIRPLKDDGGNDFTAWLSYIEPFQEKTWFEIPFYFAETYFYRRIIEAINYFKAEQAVDPFQYQKNQSLEVAIDSIQIISKQVNNWHSQLSNNNHLLNEVNLINLLYISLWGNKADLSRWSAETNKDQSNTIKVKSQKKDIFIDDTPDLIKLISTFQKARIDLIADNAGFELFTDLCLIDFLLSIQAAEVFVLHLKAHPTFVSDATIRDFRHILNFLLADSNVEVRSLATRLENYFNNNRLLCREDYYWTSPLAFWDMPISLQQNLAQASLIIIKGDANYRRLLGDCSWDFTTSFEDITCYFPKPFVALRTLKSEVVAGLQAKQIDMLYFEDSDWLINGERGIIQFVSS